MTIEVHPVEVVTVQASFRFVKRGGRKEMVLPEGVTQRSQSADSTLVKARPRAFRWKRMLESRQFATIGDMAAHESIAPTHMTRVMRLTLLAPGIVEAIVDGRREFGLAELLESFPLDWTKQTCDLESGAPSVAPPSERCSRPSTARTMIGTMRVGARWLRSRPAS